MIVGHNISNSGVVIAIMEINYRHIRDKFHRNYDVKTEASNLLLLLIYTIRELIKGLHRNVLNRDASETLQNNSATYMI